MKKQNMNGTPTLFQITSDSHIEQGSTFTDDKLAATDFQDLVEPLAHFLVLPGDIGSLYKLSQLRRFLSEACSRHKHVVYVPGNYEYYHIDEGDQILKMSQLKSRLHLLAKEFDNLYVLDQGCLDIGNIRIIGATLWTHLTRSKPYIVRIPEMTKALYNKLHQSDLEYIIKNIDRASKENKKVMVVTHYPPMIAPHTRKTRYRELYENNLKPAIFEKVAVWIYGHTHDNTKVENTNGCCFFTNQWGKTEGGATGYRKNYIIRM